MGRAAQTLLAFKLFQLLLSGLSLERGKLDLGKWKGTTLRVLPPKYTGFKSSEQNFVHVKENWQPLSMTRQLSNLIHPLSARLSAQDRTEQESLRHCIQHSPRSHFVMNLFATPWQKQLKWLNRQIENKLIYSNCTWKSCVKWVTLGYLSAGLTQSLLVWEDRRRGGDFPCRI